jgi:uracil-DNA glycosylase family 4
VSSFSDVTADSKPHSVVSDSQNMAEYPDPELKNLLAETCSRCSSLVESRECISWGVGPSDADLVVVGEAPGAGTPDAERWKGGNWTGMAYTARHSGRKIREMMAAIGYPNSYYTNAIKCFPSDGEGSNREPTEEERANCRPYLIREIEQVAPVCVVATGKHATQSLLAVEGRAVDGFIDMVLEPQECPTLGRPVLPVLHPSYQEVWISRLGYSRESYLDAIRETIESL